MELNDDQVEILRELAECAEAIGPYRDDVVVTGGLVPLLYRFHPDFGRPRQPALLTADLDFTVPETLPLRDDERLRDRLENGGFSVVTSRGARGDVPAKQFFQHHSRETESLAPIHGEFLTPLTGSETDREGQPKSPTEVQDGLNAEALRYLDLLLWNPFHFDLSSIGELGRPNELKVQIPRPGAYLVQKVLCSEDRNSRDKRDKDLAYCYDVATLTHGNWDEIRSELSELETERGEWSKWIERVRTILKNAFLGENAFAPMAVERLYDDSSVRKETVERVMNQFIEEIR